MRSRYSAFALGDVDYINLTWHPDTRPADLALDADQRWTHLEIVSTQGGGPFHAKGVVEFRAHYRQNRQRGVLHERSQFVRDGGRWLYLDGVIA
ncbi:SEC-C motif-containing protein [Actinokineospora diospyrosa]|uniref:SEC-C motif-containing protein n=2 Tax=Actinokineospora diospyrosa TaxID=103728 RepID=A0ABT1I564_9PSEU|nr:SEC-C motif-containing protein [Actinokineospora diospyrosa]